MASKTLKLSVEVTPEIIKKAQDLRFESIRSMNCPIALAVNRAYRKATHSNMDKATACVSYVSVVRGKHARTIYSTNKVPARVQRFIHAFDGNETVKPLKFNLTLKAYAA